VALGILVACLAPGGSLQVDAPSWGDKAVHAAGFAALAFAWRRAGGGLGAVLVLGALLAGATEALQALLPIQRHGDPIDAAFDLAGLAAGCLLAALSLRLVPAR
jgi:hypothetical protein